MFYNRLRDSGLGTTLLPEERVESKPNSTIYLEAALFNQTNNPKIQNLMLGWINQVRGEICTYVQNDSAQIWETNSNGDASQSYGCLLRYKNI